MKQENLNWAVKNRKLLPRHIAIIMDGNGRWAKEKGLPRNVGHKAGIDKIKSMVAMAIDCRIEALTFFTFSTENWNRSKREVNILMRLLKEYLRTQLGYLMKNNVRLNVIGREKPLPASLLKMISRAVDTTRNNSGIILNIALNYGSRVEIVDAARKIARMYKTGRLKESDINEELISGSLYTEGIVDPDFLIRTSGEMRISNFLLWQISYAELYFTDTYWPDFGEEEFIKALKSFSQRERRYGRC